MNTKEMFYEGVNEVLDTIEKRHKEEIDHLKALLDLNIEYKKCLGNLIFLDIDDEKRRRLASRYYNHETEK